MLRIAIPLAPWRSGQHPKQVFNIMFEFNKNNYIIKLFLD